jgi:hypothetical protein
MKLTFFRILLSAAFCIALLSCSDDDDKKNDNKFTVEGVTVPIMEGLSSVYQTEDSDGNAVYDWHIALQGDDRKTSGEVEFSLYHDEGSSLTAGTYSFDSEVNTNMDAFTFRGVHAFTYITETDEEIVYEQAAKSGTIKVEKSGETYTFTVDVVLEGSAGDISIKGYYKGALEQD